jgi:hypothetical protein
MLTKMALHLGAFDYAVRELDLESFRAQHGDAFFVHYGTLSGFATTLSSTVVHDILKLRGETPWQYDYFVFPLRKPKLTGSVADHVIRVGRSADNDVVIPEESLSKVHAYLTRRPSGVWTLEDADSTNGTFVDDVPVPVRGQGEPIALAPGARVVMAAIELTFLHAEEFRALVKRLGPV